MPRSPEEPPRTPDYSGSERKKRWLEGPNPVRSALAPFGPE
jgi:hypothetical protein